MKILRILVIIMILFSLVGCQKEPEESLVDPSDVIHDDDHVSMKTTLNIIDHIEDVDVEMTSISIYEDDRYPGIPYVNIEDFMSMFSPAINHFTVEKRTMMTISTPLYGNDSSSPIDEHELSIEPTLNLLIYSDFNFYLALSGSENSDYESDLIMTDYEVEGNDPGLTIDLNLYGIDILYVDHLFYLPLDVANLVLTSYSLNAYRLDDDLYLFDDSEQFLEVISSKTITSQNEDQPLLDYSYRFAALLLDYFYGLKSYLHEDSYLNHFIDKNYDDFTTFKQFASVFQQQIFMMDDLHTQILDYGLDRKDVHITSYPLPYSRLVTFSQDYVKHCNINRTKDFNWIEYEDYYLLELNAFTDELKDQLENTLGKADPNKVIYIDLTCNMGGSVISVVELLAYMTSDPITLSYQNATTGAIYHETYESSEPKKVDNPFIVLTTRVTFSAANLFTSLVKDMELGLVLGMPTTGGAAAVRTTVLPNKMMMTYSTPMVFINQDGRLIENGVVPHVEMSSFYRRDQYIEESNKIYQNKAVYTIDDQSTLDQLNLSIDTSDYISDLHLNSYTIEVIDGITKRILYTTEVDTLDANIDQLLTSTTSLLKIKVYADYTYHDVRLTELIYVGFVDELKDHITDETPTIAVNQTYQTTKHSEDDIDYVRVEITEADAYKLSVYGGLYSTTDSVVYNESGDRVAGGLIFTLEPGIYYINLSLDDLSFNYSFKLERLYDDKLGGTPIAIQEGLQDVTLNYDYTGDKEWIIMTFEETMRVTISSEMYIGSDYYLTDATGIELFHSNSRYLQVSSRREALFEAGTYMMKFHREVGAGIQYTIQFDALVIEGDLSGDLSLNHAPYESLTSGLMTATFEGEWDRDIYQLTTDKAIDLRFAREDSLTVCQVTEPNVKVCKWADQLYTLEPGTHYFLFEALSNEISYSVDVDVIILEDLSDEDNVIPIDIGVPFDVIIEKDEDLDYYTFTLTDITLLELTIENGHPSYATLYDEEENLLYTVHYGHQIMQLLPGSYTLVIGENISLANEVYYFTVTLSLFETTDTDPCVNTLPDSEYRSFTLPIDYDHRIEGAIDYESDQDWFIIHITSDQKFRFSMTNSTLLRAYLVDGNGVRLRLSNNNDFVLKAGTYYLQIYALSMYTSNLEYYVVFG